LNASEARNRSPVLTTRLDILGVARQGPRPIFCAHPRHHAAAYEPTNAEFHSIPPEGSGLHDPDTFRRHGTNERNKRRRQAPLHNDTSPDFDNPPSSGVRNIEIAT
jgi:hypothetical protein